MGASPAIHPSSDALRAFALGKLDDSTASVLMAHLDSCPDCCKAVAALSGDDFLGRLRKSHGYSATPAPAKSLADAAPKPPANPSSPLNVPPELIKNPQYEIVRELGRGGMGVVYLARNKLMDRLEVLKVVNKTLLDRPGSVERFLREIRSAAKLSHANVVAAYSAVQFGDLLAFAMEHVEGDDLAKLVKAQGPLPVAHACYYVQQAALGLQHAYENGMVHRDIKPQNLILSRKGKKHVVKVLDFGLAKATREKAEQTELTGEGAMLGTPDYVAPEQTLDAAHADIRADIYSLGCTLYYLLTGAPPFKGRSLFEILQAHHSMEANPLNLIRPEVPEELAAVVRKMMAKEPAKRYQTPAEAVQALTVFIKPGAKGASAKSLSELSMGADAKPTRSIMPAVGPAAETSKQPPVREEPSPVAWDTLTEDSITSAQLRRSATIRKRQPPARRSSSKRKWLIGGGVSMPVLLLILLGLWSARLDQTPPATPEIAKASRGDGFMSLFNGKDLTGWFVESGDANAWQVKDGELVAIGSEEGRSALLALLNQGYLLTGRYYSDIVLRFQFQQVVTKYAWGGVALRAVPYETARNADPTRRPELDLPLHLTVIVGQDDPRDGPWVTGSLWWKIGVGDPPCLAPDNLGDLKKPGEWNDMEVEMRGQFLRIAVNGRDVQKVMLSQRRPDANPVPGLSRSSGRIGFLKRVGEVRYRNIEIKELPPD
jgi:serine/threonine protein kinase